MGFVPAAIAVASFLAAAPSLPPSEHHDDAAFARARKERRLIVIMLVTEWCHWCHVMDEKTWADPEVKALAQQSLVLIREDADARPDLADRYAEWGWPAIAVLTADGAPITELRGYQSKERLLPLLRDLLLRQRRGERIARPPPPPPPPVPPGPLSAALADGRAQLDGMYDQVQGGWSTPQKYPVWAPLEHLLLRARLFGDATARARAAFTLAQQAQLIDPIAGGMFQYSLDGVWTAPHTEKLAELNGAALGTYALGARAGDARAAQAGRAIHRWLITELRNEDGAFYANMDADVGTRGERPHLLGKYYYARDAAGRARAGRPFVDANVYASHNGRVIAGLARFAGAVHDDAILADAIRAAHAIRATHRTPLGFAHGGAGRDHGALLLIDQVAMGQAFLELYETTLDRQWRTAAEEVGSTLSTKSPLWDAAHGRRRDRRPVRQLRRRAVSPARDEPRRRTPLAHPSPGAGGEEEGNGEGRDVGRRRRMTRLAVCRRCTRLET